MHCRVQLLVEIIDIERILRQSRATDRGTVKRSVYSRIPVTIANHVIFQVAQVGGQSIQLNIHADEEIQPGNQPAPYTVQFGATSKNAFKYQRVVGVDVVGSW